MNRDTFSVIDNFLNKPGEIIMLLETNESIREKFEYGLLLAEIYKKFSLDEDMKERLMEKTSVLFQSIRDNSIRREGTLLVHLLRIIYIYNKYVPEHEKTDGIIEINDNLIKKLIHNSIIFQYPKQQKASQASAAAEEYTELIEPNNAKEEEYIRNNQDFLNSLLLEKITEIKPHEFSFRSIYSVTIPNFVETIGEYAFAITPLTHITIPKSVKFIGDNAFEGTGITPEMIPESVRLRGDVFRLFR
jgi:hypothetical protein